MLKFRIISFPVLFGAFLLMVLNRQYGPVIFGIIVVLAFPILCKEILTMVDKKFSILPKIGYYQSLSAAIALVLYNLQPLLNFDIDQTKTLYLTGSIFFGIPIIIFLLLVASKYSLALKPLTLVFGDYKKFALKSVYTILTIGVVFGVFGWLVTTYAFTTPTSGFLNAVSDKPTTGMWYLFYLVVVTKMMDTGGYIFGMLSNRWMRGGNHKIMPSVSPNKSYEGTFGGLLFSVAASVLFSQAVFGGVDFSLTQAIIFGALLGVGSLAGDLTESFIKRRCSIKDSGSIIPGMGGVFDVVDSFIYNAGLFFLFI